MGGTEVYEIARYEGCKDDAELIDRVQLVSVGRNPCRAEFHFEEGKTTPYWLDV